MTPVDEICAEFERLVNTLSNYPRPDPRTKFLFSECADVLQRASDELVPFLTATQIVQLKHAYWHFMDTSTEEFSEAEGDSVNGAYLEDLCQTVMHFGHDVIRNPDKYPAV